MTVEEAVIRLRRMGFGSPRIARMLGIPRSRVNSIMRKHARRPNG